MKKEITFSILLVAALLVVILIERNVERQKQNEFGAPKAEKLISAGMAIRSADFKESEYIPTRFTCDGERISPTLEFSGVPKDAVALALIVEDQDMLNANSDGVWSNWVLFDMPEDTTKILPGEKVDGIYGNNSKGEMAYDSPCASADTHRYIFRLYALDTKLGLPAGSTKEVVMEAMKGHILRQASLIGLHDRSRAIPAAAPETATEQ